MGRLTLNVLLSFAQFEREVTAERIRDKIAASKRKGLWMGGSLPLGYDPPNDPVKERVLQINEAEAVTVRKLFALYLQYGSLTATRLAAVALGLSHRKADHRLGLLGTGSHPTGSFSNGQMHYLLTNPVYRGYIRHKALVHAGQHLPIIDEDLWHAVQSHLTSAAARKRRARPLGPNAEGQDSQTRSDEPTASLVTRLFDETGDRLTPSHTNRHGRRFRYYVSRRLLTDGIDPTGWRLPAPALEDFILAAVRDHLRQRAVRNVSTTLRQRVFEFRLGLAPFSWAG